MCMKITVKKAAEYRSFESLLLRRYFTNFNLYVAYIMQNAKLDEAQAGIKIAGRNINNLRYADDTTLNGRK